MKSLLHLARLIILGFLGLFFVTGCFQQTKEGGNAVAEMPVEERPIENVQDCLSVISNPEAPLVHLDFALAKLRELREVEEPASFWVKIVDDPRYSLDHRGRCVSEYFRRHIKVPISVARLGEMPGIRRWFRKATVDYALRGNSAVDFKVAEQEGHDVVSFVPEFFIARPATDFQSPRPSGMLCIKLSGQVLIDRFLEIIQGKRADSKLLVVRIDDMRHNTNLGCLHVDEHREFKLTTPDRGK